MFDAVLCDEISHDDSLHGVRRDRAEEVVVESGERRGCGAWRNHRDFRRRRLLIGVLDDRAQRRANDDRRVLRKYRLHCCCVLVRMLRVRGVGRDGADLVAEHSARFVNVLLGELHGRDVRGAQICRGSGEREQTARNEGVFRRICRAVGCSRAASRQCEHCRRRHCGGRGAPCLSIGLVHLNRRFLSCLDPNAFRPLIEGVVRVKLV